MSPPPNPSNSYSQVHEECHTNVIINHIALLNLNSEGPKSSLMGNPLTPLVGMNGCLASEDVRSFLFQFSAFSVAVVFVYPFVYFSSKTLRRLIE